MKPPADKQQAVRPYPPSWIDRFIQWVEKLPGPWWSFYVILALALVILQAGVQWLAGTYPPGTFNPFHIWLMAVIPYFLALLHYLNRSTEAALKTSLPALKVDEKENSDLHYRLINLPARPTIAASLISVGVIFAVILFMGGRPEDMGFSSTPLSLTFFIFSWAVLWWIFGAFFYKVIRQLRLISRIYATHASINLYQLSPLYAFSGVTARLAIALALQNYLWQVTFPQTENAGPNIGIGIVFLLLALIAFVFPLWGLHQRLVEEKTSALNENGMHFEKIAASLHGDVEAGTLENSSRLKDMLTGLEIERNQLQKIPTWPWQPETLRGMITALLLPVIVFLIQYVLQRVLGN